MLDFNPGLYLARICSTQFLTRPPFFTFGLGALVGVPTLPGPSLPVEGWLLDPQFATDNASSAPTRRHGFFFVSVSPQCSHRMLTVSTTQFLKIHRQPDGSACNGYRPHFFPQAHHHKVLVLFAIGRRDTVIFSYLRSTPPQSVIPLGTPFLVAPWHMVYGEQLLAGTGRRLLGEI